MRWTAVDLAHFEARRTGEASSAPRDRRPRPALGGKPQPSELQAHIAIAQHLRMRARPGVFWFHPANGELRDKATAAKLKAMGVRPGTPDLIVLVSGRLHGLELKRHDGRLTPEQRACHAEIEAAGGFVATAWDTGAALRILEAWGAIRPDPAQMERAARNG